MKKVDKFSHCISGNSVKKAPPYCGEIFIRGGLSYLMFPPKAENFGNLTLKMIIFLREIVLESSEKPKIFRLRRAKSVKELKTFIKSAAGEKILGIQNIR